MASTPDEYFCYEHRLSSFQLPQPVTKRRDSATAGKRAPKTLSWPHKKLAAADMARAGFYFHPVSSNPDNVHCFLCQKSMDGWEDNDDPLVEHLKHSPDCGYAVLVAIEAEVDDMAKEDPNHPRMLEARKATFAGKWPHDNKKAWKCKSKEMVEAGWMYTPTMDSDDMAACPWCQLALDGWERSDKPMDEHYKRSPECPFFTLISQYQSASTTTKKGRTKTTRGSKASRMSVQSVTTATSELPSTVDVTAEPEDSVMTATSVMTQGGTKKTTRGKKTTTARGRKTRTKKDEAVEVVDDDASGEDGMPAPPLPKPKATRGKKRTSDAMEDSTETAAEVRAPKKRATRARASQNVETSALPDVEMVDAPKPARPAARKTGRGSSAPSRTVSRKTSAASVAPHASLRDAADEMPDDDELERQLQADLERPFSDDDDIAADSESERRKAPAASKTKTKKTTTRKASAQSQPPKDDYAMFDPSPVEPDEAAVDAELKALETEMETEEMVVPKKGRKAGIRKASKQAVPKKTKTAAYKAKPEPEPQQEETTPPEVNDEDELSMDMGNSSSGTVVKGGQSGTGKRGRPRKKSSASQADVEELPPPGPAAVFEEEHIHVDVEVEMATVGESFTPATDNEILADEDRQVSPSPKEKALPPPPAPAQTPRLEPPATPRTSHISPAPSARQAALSPSQSPQSSDAENKPPSSRPATSASTRRVVLAPMPVATPARGLVSPSKRAVNVIAGLESTRPWTAVDLELVFAADKENDGGAAASGGDLSSPEKRMTVEEWIYYNAGQAEEKLRHECEAMVSRFEREGTRAMQVLEGIVVD